MRSAYYILAVIILSIAGLAVAISVCTRQPAEVRKPPLRVVYVDVDRLLKLHPGSVMLAQMKALVTSPGAQPAAAQLQASRPPSSRGIPSRLGRVIELPTISREEIESEIAQSAVDALAQMEADEMQALRARLTARRATMMENARADIVAQVREIDQAALSKQRSLVAQLGHERLAAQIRSDALQASLRVLSKEWGVKPEEAKSEDSVNTLLGRASRAEDQLKEFSTALSSESLSIAADALAQTTKIRAASAARIAADIAAIESSERSKIERAIAVARDEIMDEMNSSGLHYEPGRVPGPKAVLPSATVVARSPMVIAERLDLGAVLNRISSIEERVRLDVVRAVKAIAADEHVQVTFARRTAAGVPDATRDFAAKLKAKGMSAWTPVIAASEYGPVAVSRGRRG